MLIRLSIKNYALIRELDIEFGKSFSVITGETGAGKSIILGALSLILGQRIDNQSFSDNTAKCSIEGAFDISKCTLESYFVENDLDFEPVCIIRREITPQGKSRAFVNDTPVNLNQLKEITGKLVDVHSQHQTLLLQESSFQLSVVDSVAGSGNLLTQYKAAFKELNDLIRKKDELLSKQKQSQSDLDYLNFLFDELDKVRLVPGEQIYAESEVEILSHAEEIKAKLFYAADALLNRDENLLKQLIEIGNNLGAIAKFHSEIGSYSERLKEINFELKDLATSVDRLAENTSFDPSRLEQLNERLTILYQLEQKHHVRTVEELIEIRDGIEIKIKGVNSLSEMIDELSEEISIKNETLQKHATALSNLRKESLPLMESEVLKIITQLGMKDARFSISMTQLPAFGLNGIDNISFLFSANKGTPLNDLSRVASGGELSRLMLAVKSMISSSSLLPTIIFDEIDSGISGDVASKVGNILKKISEKMQVIVITHLPQIAGRSNEHFKVYKFTEHEKTFSSIDRLSDDDRISELALMISGNPNLEAARETAKELLRNN
jgi:DNA repair protein RecN (Recombination protein N)